VGGVHDVPRPALGRLEQTHRPAVDLRRAGGVASSTRRCGAGVGTHGGAADARRHTGAGRCRARRCTTVRAGPSASEQVTLVTDVLRATFDSRGGELVRLEMLAYADQNNAGKPVVLFDRSGQRVYLAQSGLITTQSGVALPNHMSAMTAAPGERTLSAGRNELALRFESAESGGVVLAKTYTFKRSDYTIDVRHEVINRGSAPVAPQLYLQLARDGNPPPGESSFYFTFTGPAVYTEAQKFQKIDFKDIERAKAEYQRSADNGWIAMVQHYFASAWLVNTPQPREFRTAKVSDNLYSVAMVLPMGEVAPGASKTQDAQLYAGPQEENKLATLAPGLDLVKDYGWFTILAKPLFWVLDQLYKLLGNWGWSIVALVVLLKIAFYWLNAKAYSSMAKMKAINPKVMAMRERYKDKPQQMQQEMMRIYREEKVNPLGGCLPILVQMPFFIALYWVLLSSVEMRNAPWIGWIQDLSAIDPYFILPLLMTASTMFQTWLNPTPPDPVQARMMWIMPLVFSVMFFFFPAGLVLYWLTNNLLSIAQQWFINKRLGVL
jgi:YidC/Oxa1 family membrane protein insertase